ncbi:MAG TPA: ABC transporter ATP-binding protein [Acidimicrobiia bacterium]|nr:ABC transporter ATP-binding protein [Acidimicrobiia bacterium]
MTKDYGDGAGVFDLDIEIDAGTIVGFIGPSGCGKTTTIRMLTGVIAPDSGEVEVLGERPVAFRPRTRARIGYMPQHAILYPELTLRENLNFAASLYGMPYRRRRRIKTLVDFVDLAGAMNRLPEEASGGERRRVMLASTLIHSPDLLFLDEPTAGIDPVLRRKFWDRFRELAEAGKTIVVTTQYVGEAAYCDYVAVMAAGRILTVDTPDELRHKAYGGDVIEFRFDRNLSSDEMASLESLPEVASEEWVGPGVVRVVVADPERARTVVADWASERDIELSKSEAYLAPFDDVFVELISRLEAVGSHEE